MTPLAGLLALLQIGPDGRWAPGIGDPSPLGWLTVAAYGAAACASLAAARASRRAARSLAGVAPREAAHQRQLAGLWALATVVLVALGINKQLDLQTWLTETLRDAARAQGWYDRRRDYQLAFVATLTVAGALGTAGLAYHLRRVARRVAGALVGLGLIASFVVARAAWFHHVDLLLGVGSARLGWVLELSGIALVGLSARRSARATDP